MPHRTLFTSIEFVEAVSRSMGVEYRPLAIPVEGSGAPRTMYGAASPAPYNTRYVRLAPFDLYASPGWEGELEQRTVERIVRYLRQIRTRAFVWSVRFDHSALARGLESLEIPFQEAGTHVLHLKDGHDRVASGYNATIRNEIRKAARRGVSVRDAANDTDVGAYHELHTRLVQQKDWRGFRYPLALFLELVRLRDSVRLLIAEFEGTIVSGALFFRDARSILYWHAAADRRYSHLFASRAILDQAIRWACESGADFVDFGGSAGIDSLEQFKSSWGARPATNRIFRWANPIWSRLSALKALLKQGTTFRID